MNSYLVSVGLAGSLVVAKVPQNMENKARVMATQTTLHSIEHTLHLHNASEENSVPLNGIAHFVRQNMKRSDGKNSDIDAWGRPFAFTASGRFVVASSAGKDGIYGNADDIVVKIDPLNY